jgi:hypothetical protein
LKIENEGTATPFVFFASFAVPLSSLIEDLQLAIDNEAHPMYYAPLAKTSALLAVKNVC